MNPLKKLIPALVIAALISVPAKADFLTSLKAGVSYTLTVTNGDNNSDATAFIIFAVSGSGVSVLDTEFVRATVLNPFSINVTAAKRVDALVVQASPAVQGDASAGTFTMTVTNTVTQAVVVPTKQYMGDHQLVFQVVP
jgi:hypothetical protein